MAERVDYVLVYQHSDFEKEDDREDTTNSSTETRENLRRRFVVALRKESLDVEEERVGKYVFVKITCPVERLYQEAEAMRVELPLHGLVLRNPEKKSSMIERRMKRIFSARSQMNVQVTAPFQRKCLSLFTDSHPNHGQIFWSALRSILVFHILSRIDIARKGEQEAASSSKLGLAYLRMIDAYVDGFVAHDPSSLEPISMRAISSKGLLMSPTSTPENSAVPAMDLRRQLKRLWGGGLCRRQPINLIRDYFGEKIAFYFAWVSIFIASLWVPALLGLIVFVFGVIKRYTESPDEQGFLRYIEIIRNSSDNALTPCFAVIICLWGTILMEVWKRRQISLAHQWHVEDFDMVEPDRPQFKGTHTRTDPLTGELKHYYPFIQRLLKYFTSASAILFMVMLVFISVTSVILYRVFMTVSFCKKDNGLCNFLHGTVLATFLNTVSIMILGKLYEHIAFKLTDWENHRTTSEYTDALIIKLYAFQFANTYTSLFYTAFFRRDFNGQGIFGLGKDYTDNCGDKENSNCMSLLSFQLLVLMIVKPFPKFLKDVVIPLVKKLFRSCRVNEINDVQTDGGVSKQHYLLREKFKESAEDFRLAEFNEKMIQYGYLMMFAASFPLAPLLALLFNVFDMRMDARRLLWWTKRPTPYRDNDIGIWFHIIHFINICAVISNAFLIAFNSEVGRDQELEIKFAIIIGFEHLVFLMKFAVSLIIPDTPTWVKNSQRKERFLISYLMSRWATSPVPPSDQAPQSSEDGVE